MQRGLDFGGGAQIVGIRDRLRAALEPYVPLPPRTPVGQLVKSIISSRTKDEVSRAAYDRLVEAYPDWASLARAKVAEVQPLIAPVTFPEVKAPQVIDALRIIGANYRDFDLKFLRSGSVGAALAWLEALPGVGRKVSASTLNFSTLELPAFVIDTHILRILRRLKVVSPRADTEAAFVAMMKVLDGWSAAEIADLHVLLKRLGQTVCRHRRPDCAACPIRGCCDEAGQAVHLQ
jgi:endonuclease-3